MKPLRLSLALGLAALAAATPARAADEAQLNEVHARLSLAAAPWCGKATELLADGRRRCTLPMRLLSAGQSAQALQLFSSVAVTASLLRALDADELAVVVGHEFAHFALGHGWARVQQQAPGQALPYQLEGLLSDMPRPHADTPNQGPAQERDADALGQLFALRAGYHAAAGQRLFSQAVERLAGWESAAAGSATHPPLSVRAQALAARAQALCQRLRAGQPLLPSEDRLLPAQDYRREEAQAAPLPPTSACAGVP